MLHEVAKETHATGSTQLVPRAARTMLRRPAPGVVPAPCHITLGGGKLTRILCSAMQGQRATLPKSRLAKPTDWVPIADYPVQQRRCACSEGMRGMHAGSTRALPLSTAR